MTPETLRKPRLLQPYCKRADTGAYTMDALGLVNLQNACKTA